jgi:hypothetical protein
MVEKKFTVKEIMILLQSKDFYDWYNGGGFDDWVQLAEDSGLTEIDISKWLDKKLSKITKVLS